jgi:surface polysaccharide O-acyltransferase-like enzyme
MSVTVIGTYFLTRDSGQFDGFFYDFVSLNVILASSAIFLLLRWLSDKTAFRSPAVQAITRSLATAAFGIYLLHVIVMEVLSDWIPFLHVNTFLGHAIWSVPLVSTIVFLLSFLIVRTLQKIPVIRNIVP